MNRRGRDGEEGEKRRSYITPYSLWREEIDRILFHSTAHITRGGGGEGDMKERRGRGSV